MMKYTRYIPLFIFLFACSFLLPSTMVKAADQSFVSVSTVYESSRTKDVTISLYIHGTEEIAGGSLDLFYDKALLNVKDVTMGDALADYMTSVNKDQAGKVSLAWVKESGKTQEGTLLTVTARLVKANEKVDLDLKNVQLLTEDYDVIKTNTFDGEIKPFKGESKKYESKVKGNKKWNVLLNQNFNPATVNPHTVKVKDSKGNEVKIKLDLNQGSSDEFIVIPQKDYDSGTYTLEITEQVRSLNGSQLSKPIRYEFTVE